MTRSRASTPRQNTTSWTTWSRSWPGAPRSSSPHRYNALTRVDRIYVMEHGRITGARPPPRADGAGLGRTPRCTQTRSCVRAWKRRTCPPPRYQGDGAGPSMSESGRKGQGERGGSGCQSGRATVRGIGSGISGKKPGETRGPGDARATCGRYMRPYGGHICGLACCCCRSSPRLKLVQPYLLGVAIDTVLVGKGGVAGNSGSWLRGLAAALAWAGGA